MSEFEKTSEQTAASTIVNADEFLGVQSSTTVLYTGSQIATYVAGASALTTVFQALSAGIANTVQITGEYLFTEDNELDYSSSLTNDMSAATITITELPADTVSIWVEIAFSDVFFPVIAMKRSEGGSHTITLGDVFADGGTNEMRRTQWLPTENNTIRITQVVGDQSIGFFILGYKTGS